MLNDRERLVRQCIIQRLKEPEALAYLKANGHEMPKSSYWRIRSNLQATKLKRLYEIGQEGFEDQHLERIDTLEWCHQELVVQYHTEKDPYKKAKIISFIVEIQPYLAGFYDVTRKVIEKQAAAANAIAAAASSQSRPQENGINHNERPAQTDPALLEPRGA